MIVFLFLNDGLFFSFISKYNLVVFYSLVINIMLCGIWFFNGLYSGFIFDCSIFGLFLMILYLGLVSYNYWSGSFYSFSLLVLLLFLFVVFGLFSVVYFVCFLFISFLFI